MNSVLRKTMKFFKLFQTANHFAKNLSLSKNLKFFKLFNTLNRFAKNLSIACSVNLRKFFKQFYTMNRFAKILSLSKIFRKPFLRSMFSQIDLPFEII